MGDPDLSTKNTQTGFFVQDDWTVMPRLTLNLGVRYDVSLNQFANKTAVPPFLVGNRPAADALSFPVAVPGSYLLAALK